MLAATKLPAAAIGCCCILAHLLLLALPPVVSGLECMRTDDSGQKHTRDCGPNFLGCRILVYPYRVYNESAVGICRDGLKPGQFIYDCAVDCPGPSQLDWNEPLCCKNGKNCNSDEGRVINQNYCYVSRADSTVRDSLVICTDNQRCALNIVTRDTQCVEESECSQKDKWLCCTSKNNCGNVHGIPRVETLTEDDSTKASHLTASLLMSVASVIAFYVTVS